MDRNLLFNAVRETGDHGPLNSWDRLPYWTLNGVDDGFHDPAGRSLVKARDIMSRNFMINGCVLSRRVAGGRGSPAQLALTSDGRGCAFLTLHLSCAVFSHRRRCPISVVPTAALSHFSGNGVWTYDRACMRGAASVD
jgi:hypothetical protein